MPALLFVLVFFLGTLSMGLQLIASRVLAPFFGSSILVWAGLITTFLAAFSAGSFAGAAVSAKRRPVQRKIMAVFMVLSSAALLFNSLGCYAVCDWLDLRIENLPAKLITTCLLLFFVPIAGLSTITPVCVAYYNRRGISAGRSAGLLNGVSTLGNIAGVLIAALVLVPTFGIHTLLQVWWISSIGLQLPLWFVLYSPSPASSADLSLPLSER
jgi:predicted membrane-bound spermidine synthase